MFLVSLIDKENALNIQLFQKHNLCLSCLFWEVFYTVIRQTYIHMYTLWLENFENWK